MSDKLRKALENAISVIESVRESGAVDADDLLWLDRECAAAANAGYIALAARHDSLGRELSANYDDDPAHYLPGEPAPAALAPAAREDPRPAGPWTGDPADYDGDEGR